MGYQDYLDVFEATRNQYNVMALVGNGFDIQALATLGESTDTKYESFYHFLKYRNFDASNRILERMESLRKEGSKDWSDIEQAVGHLIEIDRVGSDDVATDLRKIQCEFSNFLDQNATPDVLSRLGEVMVANGLTMTSFTEFLGDIDDNDEYSKMRLVQRLDIGDVFNFKFINFNYTTLLDNFVYLDQRQFDPHPFMRSDRNVEFHPNPRGHAGGKERREFHMVSYLVSDVVHPHGIQYTPRSLLFGIDEVDDPGANLLSKPYWAQNRVKYGDLFSTTDLFIIFGCSLGETDRWWWRAIIDALMGNDDADLILYWRRSANEAGLTASDLRTRLAIAAGWDADPATIKSLEEKVRVVLYDDSTERAWLNTNPARIPSWKIRDYSQGAEELAD